jgi:hypothetical protein
MNDVLEELDYSIDRKVIHNTFGELTLEDLPSKSDPNFQKIQRGFPARRNYIKELGFVLFQKEMAQEIEMCLEKILGSNDEFLELEAGTGSFTLLLNNLGFSGYGITLEIEGKHWGMRKTSVYYKKALEKQLLFLSSLEEWDIKVPPKLIIANWIPYKGGQEIIDFFNKLIEYPEYFMVTHEDVGGCIASDEFFDWLNQHYKSYTEIENYESFSTIYDRIFIYERI